MPVLDGLEATRQIKKLIPATRILMLPTFDLDEYVVGAVKAGASGFLLKDVPREQLVLGIRMVAAGEALAAPSITRRLIERFVTLPGPTQAETALSSRPRARSMCCACSAAACRTPTSACSS